MRKILPSRFRYPIFFLAFMVFGAAALLHKYAALQEQYVVALSVIGFLMFFFSIVLP
ncbi:MAG: hypothetical protein M1125_01250 [Candidatus Marsarchaeota archaeon]|nr:hypothetical protein [Candidatus Marsarchaeota archaeon]